MVSAPYTIGRVSRFDLALSRVHALQGKEGAAVDPLCRTLLLSHGVKAGRCFLLLHGSTNCPQQFAQLAAKLHEGGDSVLVPRYPRLGLLQKPARGQSLLTADELVRYANDVADIAQGLAERVTVCGLSLGGLLAAWLAQHRADITRAVAIAPAFRIRGGPPAIVRRAAAALPGRFFRRDGKATAELSTSDGHPRLTARAYAAILQVARQVELASRARRPKAGSIGLLVNGMDQTVDNRQTLRIAEQWKAHGARVDIRELPAELGLPHDLIDPANPRARTALVYSIVLDLMNA